MIKFDWRKHPILTVNKPTIWDYISFLSACVLTLVTTIFRPFVAVKDWHCDHASERFRAWAFLLVLLLLIAIIFFLIGRWTG